MPQATLQAPAQEFVTVNGQRMKVVGYAGSEAAGNSATPIDAARAPASFLSPPSFSSADAGD